MFSLQKHLFICIIIYILNSKSCMSEAVAPSLVLYTPGEPEYTDVLVKHLYDNLTLVCELRGDTSLTLRSYVWNYVADNVSYNTGGRPFIVEPMGPAVRSTLVRPAMRLTDSGRYMCSAPPFSVTKYILVQGRGPVQCARGAFWCGARCVLVAYVCDGRPDCLHGEDEDVAMCDRHVCARPDKLNCSTGRCISEAACCRGGAPLCQQPACCDEFMRRGDLEGYADVEYPPLFEDRHAPDDYGFIQSTIYTVTACALIFMIAVVLLVSAICKMQMKRAALRGYAHADRATAHHYSVQYHQTHRYPPCYEASRLLEAEGAPPSPPLRSPARAAPPDLQCVADPTASPRGLARLSAIFSSRYRQVPTAPTDVELTLVPSLVEGPRAALPPYRSPACGAEHPGARAAALAAELNCASQPLQRVVDQLDRQRLTLQLGRFQLHLPRWARGAGAAAAGGGARPGTPDVAALDLLDTYTLNGRTIRLLGADIHHYPPHTPPSYTEAVRYKLYGPPPEYLSREALDRRADSASNQELPPGYDELRPALELGDSDENGNNDVDGNDDVSNGIRDVGDGNDVAVNGNDDVSDGNAAREHQRRAPHTASVVIHDTDRANGNISADCDATIETLSSIIDNLPAIDSDVNANDADTAGAVPLAAGPVPHEGGARDVASDM